MTSNPGECFLDRIIDLVEGACRQKTPNEIALGILLAGFSIVFLVVCATLCLFRFTAFRQPARGLRSRLQSSLRCLYASYPPQSEDCFPQLVLLEWTD